MATISLGDGRVLSYHVNGAANGQAVLFVHGVSDSGVLRHHNDALTASLGVRLIGVDLPGVGQSSPLRGHTLIDWVGDARRLVDAFQLDQFVVLGHSGGASHALALAHHLPSRVSQVVLVAPTGPADDPARDRAIVSKELQTILWLHRWHLYPVMRWIIGSLSRKASKDISTFIEDTAINYPADSDVFDSRSPQRAIFEASFRAGMAQGGEGVYELFRALFAPWGFRIEDVLPPVTIFYGDRDDVIDPEMPQRLARTLRQSTLRVWRGCGHYSFVSEPCWRDVMGAATNEEAAWLR